MQTTRTRSSKPLTTIQTTSGGINAAQAEFSNATREASK
jgi:hypothetical protein